MDPGADLPNIPLNALVRIGGVTHTYTGSAMRSTIISPGSLIVMAAPNGMTTHGHEVPIIVGMVVDTSSKNGILAVAWYLPELARMENFRGGAKKQIVDMFGPWVPVDDMSMEAASKCHLPVPIVSLQSVLKCNFELGEDLTLPYDVLDAVRTRNSTDLTGFNLSMTRRGNIYRSYVLMRGA